jgi:RinA family phage transcriptional activator
METGARTMKLEKHVKKYIEGELTSYLIHKKKLQQEKQNAYLQQCANGYAPITKSANYSSSEVERKALYLMTDRTILRLENSVQAIENVLSDLSEELQTLIELKYFKDKDNQFVADQLNISLRTFYHWRDKALLGFARGFGFI